VQINSTDAKKTTLVPAPVYVVLLHHPIRNRNGLEVTTAVTNMDIHDIARTSRTYGVKRYFIVTPIQDQHELVGRILSHWRTDRARTEHPDRVEALSGVELAGTFSEVKERIHRETGEWPEVVLTDARRMPNQVSYTEFRREWQEASAKGRTRPLVIVYGTGWGVAESFFSEVHRILDPIYGPGRESGYNHLSVRAAAAVILDRLFGE
jgi:hypothetical protein